MSQPSGARRTRRLATTLSQERIVATALELLDTRGAQALSLRKVAGALGAGVNSLYWYVESKDQLLDLVADAVLSHLQLPVHSGDWRVDCRVAMTRLRALLLRHPHAVGIVVTRPPMGPQALRSAEWLLQALHDAGFAGLQLHHVHSTLLTYTFGKVMQEVAVQERLDALTTDARAPVAAPGGRVGGIDADRYPRTSELLGSHLVADREVDFLAGLQAILNGFDPTR